MQKSRIKWTESTHNFWTGCSKVSEGCKYCYMHRIKDQYGQNAKLVSKAIDATFNAPLNWKKGTMIFTCSMSDFFIEDADKWREDAWDVIRKTPHHIWQILTKRPERIFQCLPEDWGNGWDHVWLGTSIEQNKYLKRAEILSQVPAQIRFISAEPLLEQINIEGSLYEKIVKENFHWCIIGGESGNEIGPYKYRECKQEWIEKIINDLKDTSMKIFVKQMGTFLGKKLGMTDRNGEQLEKFPAHLQIQDWPDNLITYPELFSDGNESTMEASSHFVEEELIEAQSIIIEKEDRIFDGAELLNMGIIKIPTLIDPILPKVCLMALIGSSDTGKSSLLLQLCNDIVLNNNFLGFPINAKHMSTLYVSTEDDKFAVSNRLQKLKGCDLDKIKKCRFLFDSTNLIQTINSELKKQKADLVVIDTFTDVYTGEMNQINKIRSFLNDYFNLAIKYQCAIIFNHHTGKYTEEKEPSKTNSIGSAGFEGKVRVVMELRQDYEVPSKRHLCFVKHNYLGPEYKCSSYELDFDPLIGFKSTGNRKEFSKLARPKLFKPFANKEVEKDIVSRLHKKGRTVRRIEEIMKRLGYAIGKSTVSEWTKTVRPENNTK